MSLINEALRKARLEAARQDASQRGIRYPASGELGRRSPVLPIVAVVGLLALVGGLLYWLGGRSTRDLETTVTASADPAAGGPRSPDPAENPPATTGAEPTAEPPAGRGGPPQPRRSAQPQGSAEPPARQQQTRPQQPQRPPEPTSPRAATSADRPPEARREGAASSPGIESSSPTPLPAATPREPTPVEREPPAAGAIEAPAVDVESPEASPAAVGSAPPIEDAVPAPTDAETFVREASIPGVGDLRLGGIAWSERQPYALINGRVVGPGDRIEGLMVSSVGKAEVVLRGAGEATYILRIR